MIGYEESDCFCPSYNSASICLPDEESENQNAGALAANAFLTLYNSPDHE